MGFIVGGIVVILLIVVIFIIICVKCCCKNIRYGVIISFSGGNISKYFKLFVVVLLIFIVKL